MGGGILWVYCPTLQLASPPSVDEHLSCSVVSLGQTLLVGRQEGHILVVVIWLKPGANDLVLYVEEVRKIWERWIPALLG